MNKNSICSRPIVHRAGGMLLQSKKEFVICADLHPDDVFFYYTTTYVILIRIRWSFNVKMLSSGDG
jgi:acetoacetyl-CoA synthetase